MPRLGVSEGEIGGRAAPPAHAYHQSSSRRGSLWTMLSMLLTIFMLRNLFFKDYRQEEIARLKAAGKSDAEIEALFPKPKEERIRAARDDYATLKSDVFKLKADVQELRGIIASMKVEGGSGSATGIDTTGSGEGATEKSRSTKFRKKENNIQKEKNVEKEE